MDAGGGVGWWLNLHRKTRIRWRDGAQPASWASAELRFCFPPDRDALGWKGRWRVRPSALLLPVSVSVSATAQAGKRETESATPPTSDSTASKQNHHRFNHQANQNKSKEIKPPTRTGWRSPEGPEWRNCVITDGIGDSSNLCPAVTTQQTHKL